MNETTTILVTGATGTVGSKTAGLLAKRDGINLRVGVRRPEAAAGLREAGAEVVRLDFDDAATLTEAMKDVDRVFLLTPFVENALPLVEAAVKAAKAAGVQHIVRLSAIGANASSDFHLAAEHGRAENLVKDGGTAWTVLQPGFFMDNLVKFQGESIKGQGQFFGASFDGASAYVDARDIARSAAEILADPSKHAAKTYVLTGPEALTDASVADTIAKAIGREVKYVNLDAEAYAGGMKSQGAPAWMIDAMTGLETVKAQGWAAAVTSHVEDVTGTPATPFASFASDHAAAWK